MVYAIGIGLSFFLSFLLFTKKDKKQADKILAAWLFIIGIHFLLFYLRITEQLPPFLIGIEMPLPLIHGPFLYLYTTALTSNENQNRYAWIHFLPAILMYLYMIQIFILPAEQKILIWKNEGKGYETFTFIQFSSIIVSGFGYVIFCSLALRKHRKNINNQFSNTEKINLNWLRYLIYGLGFIWILVLHPSEEILFGGVSLFIFFIGFFGIRQVGIFNSSMIEVKASGHEVNKDLLSPNEKQKYQKSGLTNEMAEELRKKLQHVMENEKVFTQSELTLTELAEYLETQPNHLSQMLNDLEGKSFYDYVNNLRVEEFKRLAAGDESQKLTIMGLASNCGFNSKSSFNRYFKKITGLSPSEYVKSISSTGVEVD